MRPRTFLYLLAILACFLSSCGGESAPRYGKPDDSEIDRRTEELLSQMTLEEKIGQMTQADRKFLKREEDIRDYFLGSLLSGGGSTPADNTPAGWVEMLDRFQSQALDTRLGIPLLYGIDAVHGNNNVKGAVVFPHNIGMGCTRNPSLVEEAARITAEEVAGTGMNWTFAPCIAVPRDERWGRTYEGFGETPELTEEMARAEVLGFQGAGLGAPERILACAKHYVGDGGTRKGRDQGDAQISEEELRRIHLPGYVAAIRAGVGSVMASYSSWNGVKMHGNRYLITDVLKGELGFEGFVVSDWAAVDRLSGSYDDKVETAVNAGIDMVMVPDRYVVFVSTMKALVGRGRIPLSRIDDAVRRILKKKVELGLFENPYTDSTLTARVGSVEHRAVARECVKQSLVLLKNENHILPLDKETPHIHVAGRNADDLGRQCGGWTITWQGGSGSITSGTTILEAIRNTVSPHTEVTYSRDGAGGEGADVGIAVIGESPYAEWQGDRPDLHLSIPDLLTVLRVKSKGIPVIAILVSGRPMILEPILEFCDALIAAWLPGTEGQGVADVVFGDYNPTGKLSHSWPRDMSQIPLNIGDADYDALFPYGYGLSY